jgi:predicted outer membrane repeat protein
MRTVLTILVVVALPVMGLSAIIHVPADYPTIQQGIDAAADGDTVVVAPDTYFENINFNGKAITVTTSAGPEITVINGNQVGTVVTFNTGEGPDSIIEGFTVTNGMASFGGGFMVYMTDPTIRNNVIADNHGTTYGGGMYCRGANPTVTANFFVDNVADDLGGGMMNYVSSPMIVNNVFARNEAFSGGAICCRYNSGAIVTNNTIHENSATSDGGGIFCTQSSSVLACNTILWDNSALVGPEISIGDSSKPSTVDISYSDVMGGKASVYVETGCTCNWGAGVIDADPLFVAPAINDYHIFFKSPCMEAGDNSASGLPPEDFEGDPRVVFTNVDIGADEFYRHLYVTGDKTPGGTIQGKFVGVPGTTPVGLFIGSGVLNSPVTTIWGDYWLQPPWVLIGPLGAIPSTGVMIITTTLPTTIPPPYDAPMQALIGLDPDSLSNLYVLYVR